MESRRVEAITWLEPVVASRETIYDAAAQLAGASQSAGQARKAIEPLRLAIQQSPWEGGPYYRLGRLYQQLGQAQLANEALGTAARLKSANATDIQTLMEASRAAQEGRTVEAVRLGRLIAERPGADPSTLVALGLLWVKSGLQEEALEAFEAASHRNEKHFASQFNLGLALLQMGRSADSLGPLARAAALLPQSLDANLTLGLAAVMSQRYVEARTALEAARRLEPSNKKVAALLATACLRLGAASEAVGILRRSGAATAGPPRSAPIAVAGRNGTGRKGAAGQAGQRGGRRFAPSDPAPMTV